jgi:hypothetical protein
VKQIEEKRSSKEGKEEREQKKGSDPQRFGMLLNKGLKIDDVVERVGASFAAFKTNPDLQQQQKKRNKGKEQSKKNRSQKNQNEFFVALSYLTLFAIEPQFFFVFWTQLLFLWFLRQRNGFVT